jgi:transcriptional regulator with XRE-family HTH domain
MNAPSDMGAILGIPKSSRQGMPKGIFVRLALMKKTWNERLSEALKDSPYNKSEFAKAVGVSSPTVTDWTSGEIKEIGAERAARACRVLGINSRWLLEGKGPKTGATSQDDMPGDYLAIPFRKVKLRASLDNSDGFEIHFDGDDDGLEPLYYRRDWIKKSGYTVENLVARKVSGSSMEPALYDGDKVLINMGSKKPKNGVVFWVIVDGHPCIKRLRKRGTEWWVTSDNPAHAKTDLPLENGGQIIGEAVEKSSTNI